MRKRPRAKKRRSRNYKTLVERYSGVLLALGLFLFVLVLALFSDLSLPFEKCVGVVEIKGELSVEGNPPTLFDEGNPGSEKIAEKIMSLNDRDDVEAVVFVVDSPGGSVVASQDIYDAIKSVEKPKVIYIRQIAASGGYYISLAGDYIIANPNSITGSIGVISIVSNYKGLLEKLGINMTTITSGKHKDFLSPFKTTDEEEIAIMQSIINETFEEFKGLVIKERKGKPNPLRMSKIDEITDGRIMSGRQAYRYGLVDELGTKQDAIDKAKELAGVEDADVCDITLSTAPSGLFSEVSRAIATLFIGSNEVGLYYK